MRAFLAALAFGATFAVAGMSAAHAQKDGNYCLSGGTTGEMNCGFETMAQCQAAMTGSINEKCVRNPKSSSGIPAPAPR